MAPKKGSSALAGHNSYQRPNRKLTDFFGPKSQSTAQTANVDNSAVSSPNPLRRNYDVFAADLDPPHTDLKEAPPAKKELAISNDGRGHTRTPLGDRRPPLASVGSNAAASPSTGALYTPTSTAQYMPSATQSNSGVSAPQTPSVVVREDDEGPEPLWTPVSTVSLPLPVSGRQRAISEGVERCFDRYCRCASSYFARSSMYTNEEEKLIFRDFNAESLTSLWLWGPGDGRDPRYGMQPSFHRVASQLHPDVEDIISSLWEGDSESHGAYLLVLRPTGHGHHYHLRAGSAYGFHNGALHRKRLSGLAGRRLDHKSKEYRDAAMAVANGQGAYAYKVFHKGNHEMIVNDVVRLPRQLTLEYTGRLAKLVESATASVFLTWQSRELDILRYLDDISLLDTEILGRPILCSVDALEARKSLGWYGCDFRPPVLENVSGLAAIRVQALLQPQQWALYSSTFKNRGLDHLRILDTIKLFFTHEQLIELEAADPGYTDPTRDNRRRVMLHLEVADAGTVHPEKINPLPPSADERFRDGDRLAAVVTYTDTFNRERRMYLKISMVNLQKGLLHPDKARALPSTLFDIVHGETWPQGVPCDRLHVPTIALSNDQEKIWDSGEVSEADQKLIEHFGRTQQRTAATLADGDTDPWANAQQHRSAFVKFVNDLALAAKEAEILQCQYCAYNAPKGKLPARLANLKQHYRVSVSCRNKVREALSIPADARFWLDNDLACGYCQDQYFLTLVQMCKHVMGTSQNMGLVKLEQSECLKKTNELRERFQMKHVDFADYVICQADKCRTYGFRKNIEKHFEKEPSHKAITNEWLRKVNREEFS